MILQNKISTASFALGLLLLAIVTATPQNSPKRSLLVASCDAVKDCTQQTLRRFVFQNGSMISQDVLATLPRDKTHFDWGGIRVFDNRHIVSGAGEVFDISTKTLFADQVGHFVAYEDGQIFIDPVLAIIKTKDKNFDASLITRELLSQMVRSNSESKTYAFDLSTKKYKAYRRPNFFSNSSGWMSPDNNKIFAIDSFSHRATRRRRSGKGLGDFSTDTVSGTFHVSCGKKCKEKMGIVPSVWIDNDRFLTQRKNGELVIFDFRVQKWRALEPISLPDELPRMPTLYVDGDGNILYEADKIYKIDIESGQSSVTNEYGLGHGFKSIGNDQNKLFIYGDKKLATFISSYVMTTDGYLAAEYRDGPVSEGLASGVRVWSVVSGTLTTMKIESRSWIIGWISE